MVKSRSTQQPSISVVIADKTAMGCQMLASTLKRTRYPFSVSEWATNKSNTLTAIEQHKPDIVLISADLEGGPGEGFQVIAELHSRGLRTRAIVLIDFPEPRLVVESFRSGAKGVFSRESNLDVLAKCIRSVHSGQIWASSVDLEILLEFLWNSGPTRLAEAKLGELTSREKEVVRLVADGMTNRSIANKLGLSEHTVKNYLFRIFEKLGVSSRSELLLKVLTQPDTPPAGYPAES